MPESQAIENIMPFGHAPSAIELSSGEILLTWYCGSYEGAEDQRIALALRTTDGKWQPTRSLLGRFDFEGESWVPEISVPLLSPEGQLWYIFWACPFSSFSMRESSLALLVASGGASFKSMPALQSVGGKVWTRDIPFSRTFSLTLDKHFSPGVPTLFREERGLVFMGAARQLGSGRWLVPYHTETPKEWFRTRFLIAEKSQDLWESRADLHRQPGCLEPVVAQLPGGKVICYMRRGGYDGHIWRSESLDEGESFSSPEPTNLRNPHAGIDIGVSHTTGRMLVVFNDSYRMRTPLTVGISEDEGITFLMKDIEAAPGSYAYPKLLQDRSGVWHLFYSENYQQIRHVRFEESWLDAGRKAFG